MAAATNQDEAREIVRAVALVKERLGVRTVLGVSNVSFGLPQRGLVNATFLAAAFGAGLDLPILNPLSARYRDTVAAFKVLNGQDAGARAFIEGYAGALDPYAPTDVAKAAPAADAGAARAEASGAQGADVGLPQAQGADPLSRSTRSCRRRRGRARDGASHPHGPQGPHGAGHRAPSFRP